MRKILIAALLTSVATPALAASHHAEDREIARTAARLSDPSTQAALSGMVLAMTDAFMDVRIDKLRAAIDRIDPDARDRRDNDDARTLGDVVARDNPYFRDDLARDTRHATGAFGDAATGMADMLPELRNMGDRIGRQIEESMRRFPRGD